VAARFNAVSHYCKVDRHGVVVKRNKFVNEVVLLCIEIISNRLFNVAENALSELEDANDFVSGVTHRSSASTSRDHRSRRAGYIMAP
jgi:hypothetical protein